MGNAQGQIGKSLTVGHHKVTLTKLLAEGTSIHYSSRIGLIFFQKVDFPMYF